MLKYPDYAKTKDGMGRTLLFYWIKYRNTDIPDELLYEGCEFITDSAPPCDYPAICWLRERRCDIP